MKKLLLILLLSAFAVNIAFSKTIVSTANGGSYSDPRTWVGEVVPGPGDDVVINGKVIINKDTKVNNVKVEKEGTLQIGVKDEHTANVNVNTLTNTGKLVIEDRSYLKTNDIQNTGQIENSGVIENGK